MAKQEIIQDWEDKAYLKYLPPELQERYRDSLSDPQLTHLKKQVALMDVRIKMLLEMIDQSTLDKEDIAEHLRVEFPHFKEKDVINLAAFIMGYLPTGFINPRTFKRLEAIVTKIERAEEAGRTKEVATQTRVLFNAIRDGRREGDVWEDVQKAMEERRKLSEAEERRMNQQQQNLPLDRVVMLAGILIESFKTSVRKYVTNPEIQRYILEDANTNYRAHLGMGYHRPADEFSVD